MSEDKSNQIDKSEWDKRFKDEIAARTGLAGETLEEVTAAELESWELDWHESLPEFAAKESLSYWQD